MAQLRFRPPPHWPAPPPGWFPTPGWQPDPAWGPPPPGWQFWVEDPAAGTQQPSLPRRCGTCGVVGSGAYCADCGTRLYDSGDPYRQVVESFLKVGEIWRYLQTYATILRSPTRNTIALFHSAPLATGVRFLEYSSAVYLLAIAASGVPLFGDNEVLKTAVQAVWLLITFTLSYTFYFLAMRRRPGCSAPAGNTCCSPASLWGSPCPSRSRLLRVLG